MADQVDRLPVRIALFEQPVRVGLFGRVEARRQRGAADRHHEDTFEFHTAAELLDLYARRAARQAPSLQATAADMRALAKDALRHRLVLSYQALAENVSPDAILDQVLQTVPVPEVSPARPAVA